MNQVSSEIKAEDGDNMISRSQLFCVLILSKLSAAVVFPYSREFSGTGLLALIAAEAAELLLALPLLIYSVRRGDFYGSLKRKNAVIGVAAGYGAAFLTAFCGARTLVYSAEFAQRTLLGGMSGAVILVLMAMFALYAAFCGAEALSRSGVLILAVAVIVTVAVAIGCIPHIHLRRAAGAEYDELFVHQFLERLMSSGEYLILAAMLPHIREKNGKSGAGATGFLYGFTALAGVFVIELFCIGVLGEFYTIAEYPLTAAAQLSDVTLFKRLDGFMGAVWSLGAAFRAGALFYSSYNAIKAVSGTKRASAERSGA